MSNNHSSQIIGIDFGHDKDYSCATTICGNCRMVINVNQTNSDTQQVQLVIHKSCPYCGTIFKHVVVEGL